MKATPFIVITALALLGVAWPRNEFPRGFWRGVEDAEKRGSPMSTVMRGKIYEPYFAQAEIDYGLPRGLLSRVAWQESRFRPDAINEGSNAIGMMQIVPRWHPGVDGNPNPNTVLDEAAARNPEQAIPYAADYLRRLYDRFGSWTLALAGYNWGPGNVEKGLPFSDWPEETQHYVTDVTNDVGIA